MAGRAGVGGDPVLFSPSQPHPCEYFHGKIRNFRLKSCEKAAPQQDIVGVPGCAATSLCPAEGAGALFPESVAARMFNLGYLLMQCW